MQEFSMWLPTSWKLLIASLILVAMNTSSRGFMSRGCDRWTPNIRSFSSELLPLWTIHRCLSDFRLICNISSVSDTTFFYNIHAWKRERFTFSRIVSMGEPAASRMILFFRTSRLEPSTWNKRLPLTSNALYLCFKNTPQYFFLTVISVGEVTQKLSSTTLIFDNPSATSNADSEPLASIRAYRNKLLLRFCWFIGQKPNALYKWFSSLMFGVLELSELNSVEKWGKESLFISYLINFVSTSLLSIITNQKFKVTFRIFHSQLWDWR